MPWIPFLAAVVGLIGGVSGVLIGSWLRDRGELRRWRLQKRSEALYELAQRADAYLSAVTRFLAPPIAAQNVNANDVLDAMFALSGAGTIVQMVSPAPIRQAVEGLLDYMAQGVMPFTSAGSPQVTADEAQQILNTYVARFGALVDIARADFGEA